MQIKQVLLLSLLLTVTPLIPVFAQTPVQMTTTDTLDEADDLMSLLEETPQEQGKEYTTATFKTTRIANGHSIENTGKGVLDFRVSHRFGRISDGFKNFFGLDDANTRIGFDYGITNWLTVGVGRASYLKEYDGFVKARILRQTEDGKMPLSVSYVGAISAQSNDVIIPDTLEYYFSNRLAYMNQILIAKKFSPSLSLQLMPTHLHYNLVQTVDEPNDVLALGVGGRLKLSNRISLNAEYYYQLPGNQLNDGAGNKTKNSLTVGFDIETGGHVFQLLFSNSTAITERNVIGQTTGDWAKGDIHFGFTISRVFTVVRPKEFQGSRNRIW